MALFSFLFDQSASSVKCSIADNASHDRLSADCRQNGPCEQPPAGKARLRMFGQKMYLVLLPLLLLALIGGGCASSGSASVNRMLDSVGNMSVARHYLGEPHVSQKLAGGGTRYEWGIDRVVRESAHYETRRVLVYYDRDGFPVFEDIEFFIPERDVHQTCRVVVIADARDNILEHSAQGSHCHLMFQMPTNY